MEEKPKIIFRQRQSPSLIIVSTNLQKLGQKKKQERTIFQIYIFKFHKTDFFFHFAIYLSSTLIKQVLPLTETFLIFSGRISHTPLSSILLAILRQQTLYLSSTLTGLSLRTSPWLISIFESTTCYPKRTWSLNQA